MSAHTRKNTTETLSDEAHYIDAKLGELNRLAAQSMIQLLAPGYLCIGLVRQAHCEASDKLHFSVISDPVFVSFADAVWANRKDFGSQCGYLCFGTERSLLALSPMSQSCTFIRFSLDTVRHASTRRD